MSASAKPVQLGIVGCGNISSTYIATLHMFDFVRVKAVTDVVPAAAQARTGEFGVEATSLAGMLADPAIDIIINLTSPVAHAEISQAALEAGKHVYSEKPLGITVAEGEGLLALARRKSLRLGGAPDTFLGAGHQLSRRLLDDGVIGQPVAGTALMMIPGHEHWHPNPDFYYQRGGGPMLDVGPYYVTNLITLLGPVRSVFGTEKITRAQRPVLSEPRRGDIIKVEVPTHTTGVMEFENGATVTIVTSFDIVKHRHNQVELYGLDGSLVTPDPNNFSGPVELYKRGEEAWERVPDDHPYDRPTHDYAGGLRGLGAAEMAHALQHGRPHRVSAELAMHALDVMTGFQRSAESGRTIAIETRCDRPRPIGRQVPFGSFD
ncbi:MAG TPA: Gfo/Idh/MocA family oxidoreductase [Acidisoma sp.]|uniref:Gfo/Idh/MocA family protein n=1 Tax=Acidisoma sp. TaxID=1872115 RepID=UPI002CEF3263|nr:Gfo/Idh/MocA family oxidoreductase [Acidisoma sp.]HTI01110.1 Gfo/Idh/MocA family oxidoreductase [Acidisoma sp.]